MSGQHSEIRTAARKALKLVKTRMGEDATVLVIASRPTGFGKSDSSIQVAGSMVEIAHQIAALVDEYPEFGAALREAIDQVMGGEITFRTHAHQRRDGEASE